MILRTVKSHNKTEDKFQYIQILMKAALNSLSGFNMCILNIIIKSDAIIKSVKCSSLFALHIHRLCSLKSGALHVSDESVQLVRRVLVLVALACKAHSHTKRHVPNAL